jgi:hypothetical protein
VWKTGVSGKFGDFGVLFPKVGKLIGHTTSRIKPIKKQQASIRAGLLLLF